MTTVDLAVPRKGRPLEAVLERVAGRADCESVADDVISALRYEKAVAKGDTASETDVYDRLASYSDLTAPTAPEFTLLRDDRAGRPRRIVFDSLTVPLDGVDLRLVGREEPFRALRTHEFALGFDSADLVLEEVVGLEPEPLASISGLNDRIDPHETDVRVVAGLGDTVQHTLLATPEVAGRQDGPLDRSFIADYAGECCISPRYERLVQAVLGTDVVEGLTFTYPDGDSEEAAIAATGLGVYLTVTGGTARDHGLVVGADLFPSETVLLENVAETTDPATRVRDVLVADAATAVPV